MAKRRPVASEAALDRYNRYHLYRQEPQTIAASDHVSVDTVKRDIAKVEAYRAMCTLDELEANQVDVILACQPEQKAAIRTLLTATKFVKRDGVAVEVPNTEAIAKGLEKMNDLVSALQPRGRGGNVNFGQQIIAQPQVAEQSGVMMFEERMAKAINRRKQALLGGEPKLEGESELPAGEVIEGSNPQGPVSR